MKREALTEKRSASIKRERQLSWQGIAAEIGGASPVPCHGGAAWPDAASEGSGRQGLSRCSALPTFEAGDADRSALSRLDSAMAAYRPADLSLL